MAYPCDGTLCGNIKEGTVDTPSNSNTPPKRDAEGQKPDIKGYILYSSIYRECSEKANLDRQEDEWLPGTGTGMRLSINRHEATFGGGSFLHWAVVRLRNSDRVREITEWRIFHGI